MARAFWKGVISFGMVAIPVRMSVATETKTLSFHYLHKKCLTRPKQVLFCPEDEIYFNVSDTVRGYEYAKDQFVVFEEADFDKVPVKTTHSIDIIGFVKAEEIDTIYYSGSHYLEPEALGVKPFTLLKTVLEKTGMVGLAKVAFQRREHLVCLRPLDKILALHTLHYKQEILPTEDITPAEPKLASDELAMATKLVEAMTTSFKPDEYRDEYSIALKEMVEAKLKGVEIKAPEIPKAEIEDLMKALRASVVAAGKR
ncbi:MAG: Ku protein [Chloroflexi bacterium RBG_16_51_9]|nr:MAG: Ku protein [Chloroflexi bacterium RBG_16_51_9]